MLKRIIKHDKVKGVKYSRQALCLSHEVQIKCYRKIIERNKLTLMDVGSLFMHNL